MIINANINRHFPPDVLCMFEPNSMNFDALGLIVVDSVSFVNEDGRVPVGIFNPMPEAKMLKRNAIYGNCLPIRPSEVQEVPKEVPKDSLEKAVIKPEEANRCKLITTSY